jgi:Flp pilus assembly protein TadD
MHALLLIFLIGSYRGVQNQSDLSQGIELLHEGKVDQALSLLERSVTQQPQSPDAHMYYGVGLEKAGALQHAIQEFGKALDLSPNDVDVLRNMAQAEREQRNWEAAAEYERRLAFLQPNSGAGRADLGYVLRRADRLSEAVEELRKAVILSPGLARAHYYLADALDQAGDSAAALVEYEKASRLEPKNAEFSFKFGLALSTDRPKDAIIEVRRSIELDPNNPDVHRTLGMLLRRVGDLQNSTLEFQRASELSKQAEGHSEAVVHIQTAIRQLKGNEFSRAIDELRMALKDEPNSSAANQLLGVALSNIGNLTEARRAFTAALQENPADPEIHFNFGVFLGRQGDFQGAVKELRQVLALRAGYPQAHCLLAKALDHLGDAEGSNRELEIARESGRCEKDPTQ